MPFNQMQNGNSISSASNDYGFYKPGEVYRRVLKEWRHNRHEPVSRDRSVEVKWYDPRNGGELQNGTVTAVTGGGSRNVVGANSTEQMIVSANR